jgi:ketosteroid isomerase-like protein
MEFPPGVALDEQGAASLALFKAWIKEAFSGKAVEAMPRFWTSDAVITLSEALPFGGTYTPDRVHEYHGKMRELMDAKPTPPQLFGIGDKVLLIGTMSGTVRKTNQPIVIDLVEVFLIKGDKIARDDFYFRDLDGIVAALS